MELGIAFLLKKTIAWLLMPMPLGMIVLVTAIWLLHIGNVRRATYFILGSIIWFAIVTHASISSLLLLPLESQYKKIEQVPSNVKYILLLGGDKERRAWEAIRLYKMIEGVKIVTSGYSRHDKLSDAYKASKLLVEAGVRAEDIVMQEDVKDTREEAAKMKERVGTGPFLLVTSAYHMPRSMILFQQEGLYPIAAPGDFNDRGEDSIWSLFQARHLQKTERAFHEYIGLLWIYLRGVIYHDI
ncbi:YdcF family protein [Sulfurovum sp. zt1-1]|uniref:YdcF family protein n=1 Tax=Sulfurovum zhangzhouensis TaxID=3019067 RepID=A0ABT7QVU2_9BACT|nr:ElyC/SanA/YdcF family protein [Sulfurovum zhangzhouensis]MDM5270963.1 YdcF family protein [Sulfurovum zhangzhouensis]